MSFWRDGPVWLLSYLVAVFGVALGAAIVTAPVASYLIGLPLALGLLWAMVLRPGGRVNAILAPWCQDRAASTPGHTQLLRG